MEASLAADGPVVMEADPFTTGAPGLRPGQIEMTTTSTRPALVTGGQARVAVRGLQADDALTVTRNGADVSSVFRRIASGPGQAEGQADGVVGGLRLGPNRLRAIARDVRYGSRQVNLTVLNHSLQGPVISGPHQKPFVCQTADPVLGPSSGPDCVAPARSVWYYADRAGQFHLLPDPYAPYPKDTASTTARPKQVPFVVRVHGSVINRSVTQVALLDDPFARGPGRPFTPLAWNHRLVYQFGQSCGTGYQQSWIDYTDGLGDLQSTGGINGAAGLIGLTAWLGQGGMVAESTLTTFGVSCNQITSAETLMMVKEHIIEDYGDITHTVGAGSSGGAIQQYTNADGYPGLIDAGTLVLSFPDVWSTAMTVYGCATLQRVFDSDQLRWTAAKQLAVAGSASPQTCKDWAAEFAPVLSPYGCPRAIPAAQVYHPKSNPRGVRCDLQDNMKSVLGADPATGFAYRPIDDVGVQYGWKALHDGVISVDDFLTVNRDIGGLSLDFTFSPKRTAMSLAQAQRMYRTGLITGRGALNETPIIDQSVPAIDYTPALDIHDQDRPFQMRARLDATFGSHASQAIWSAVPLPSNAISVADQWLDALDALQVRQPSWSRARLVAASRPAAAADQCRLTATGVPAGCDHGVARPSTPRRAAGGPLSEDNIDCKLRAIRSKDYPGASPAQVKQILAVFPQGVCDYTKSASGATARSQTWLSYGGDGTLLTEPAQVPYRLVRSGPTSASAAAQGRLPAGPRSLPSTGASSIWTWLALILLAAAGTASAVTRPGVSSR